ncbi:MAG: TonB-dependent receptor [Pseudomonadota bacterium]
MQKLLLACACALAFSFHAAADDKPIRIEVAGMRPDPRQQDTASTLVIGRDELLRQGDRNLGEVLQRVPGITLGGPGGGIRMRGLGSGYTQLLLNGVAAPAGFALETLAPELIERVEIVRSASADLGSQGIAGTINVILRKATPRARRVLKAGLDQQGGVRSPSLSAELSGKGEDTGYSVVGALGRTRRASAPLIAETGNGLQRLTRRRELDSSDLLSVTPRLDWKLGDGQTLAWQGFASLGSRTSGVEAHETTLAGAPSEFPDLASKLQYDALFLRSDLQWARSLGEGRRLDLKGGVSASRRRSDFDFGAMQKGLHLVGVHIDETGATFGGKFSAPLAGAGQVLLGWDGSLAQRAQSRSETDRAEDGKVLAVLENHYHGVIRRAALFGQVERESGAWSLSAGLRWEARSTVVADGGGAQRQSGALLSPLLHALYTLAPGHQLRLGLTRTSKAPGMFELIPRRFTVDNNNNPTNPDTQGNPALRPELAWGLDLGYEQQFGQGGLLGASAFLRRIDDVTVQQLSQDSQGWLSRPVNQGRAETHGVALEARLPLAPFEVRANLARNWSRLEQVPGPDKRLDGQTPLSANLGADYRRPGSAVVLGASLNFQRGAVARLSGATTSTSGSARQLDAYAAWTLAGATRLRIGASTLLARDAVSELRSSADGAQRRTLTRVPGNASFRLRFERDLK